MSVNTRLIVTGITSVSVALLSARRRRLLPRETTRWRWGNIVVVVVNPVSRRVRMMIRRVDAVPFVFYNTK